MAFPIPAAESIEGASSLEPFGYISWSVRYVRPEDEPDTAHTLWWIAHPSSEIWTNFFNRLENDPQHGMRVRSLLKVFEHPWIVGVINFKIPNQLLTQDMSDFLESFYDDSAAVSKLLTFFEYYLARHLINAI
jgi:hypothetical protein